MEQIVSFFIENKFLGVVAAVILIAVAIAIVKSLVKIAVVVTVIAIVMVIFFDFEPQEVIDKGSDLANSGKGLFEENLKPVFFLNNLTQEEFFIKEENGDTIIEIESLGVRYNLNELMNQLSSSEQEELESIVKNEIENNKER
ncbi:hypothetical protein GH741_16115 [Aquibacillus halophilus]|uniref:Uncharacterized protein n=1 Tax=Aquibacillus halophilus TaxID=930132 RepID=A0A6A8DEP3_9BACI|nr:hypothetical protein [Aquibacillus halophilus]MRH44168.1 hypothetical protein [Aquibacillus halophilus]